MWEYTDKVKELYMNPKNVGRIENANGFAEVGSIVCGDAMKLYLKIDEKGIIRDAKFETFGCGSAIASSSALTEMIIVKSVEEAEKITNRDIADYLGGLPEEKMHCSVMGNEALEKALANWRGEETTDHVDTEGEIVCHCFGVTDALIRSVVRENNLKTVEDVTNFTKAGGACGSCIPKIEDILREMEAEGARDEGAPAAKKPLSNITRMRMVEETITNVIRPILQRDGGDIELIDIEGRNVHVGLRGQCVNCPVSDVTMKNLVEAKLREFVEEDIVVHEVR